MNCLLWWKSLTLNTLSLSCNDVMITKWYSVTWSIFRHIFSACSIAGRSCIYPPSAAAYLKLSGNSVVLLNAICIGPRVWQTVLVILPCFKWVSYFTCIAIWCELYRHGCYCHPLQASGLIMLSWYVKSVTVTYCNAVYMATSDVDVCHVVSYLNVNCQ